MQDISMACISKDTFRITVTWAFTSTRQPCLAHWKLQKVKKAITHTRSCMIHALFSLLNFCYQLLNFSRKFSFIPAQGPKTRSKEKQSYCNDYDKFIKNIKYKRLILESSISFLHMHLSLYSFQSCLRCTFPFIHMLHEFEQISPKLLHYHKKKQVFTKPIKTKKRKLRKT